MPSEKRVIIIAGPNGAGAGKTTFAREYLPNEANCPIFVNADMIATGLSPFEPGAEAIRAGRLMLEMINSHVRAGRSFSFETTLSGRAYIKAIRDWRDAGYRVTIVFLSLPSPDEAIGRVRLRVSQGGHGLPDSVVRRRYHAGRSNFFEIYRGLVTDWILYDNSGSSPVLVSQGGPTE